MKTRSTGDPLTAVVNRRAWLRTVLGASTAASCHALGGSALGAEPQQRTGTKFKFSLAAYSYRTLLTSGELTMFDFVNDCARFGLDGTELTSYYFPTPLSSEYLTRLAGHCFRQGLDVSGTAVRNEFGHSEGAKRDEEISALKRWIEHAAVLGAPVIRVFAGHQQPEVSTKDTHANIVSALEMCSEYAGQHGVHLALENHGGPTATADGLLALVRDVKSPWFGVNLDTGNFHSDDIYGELAAVAPFALNVQVKVTVSGPDRVKRPADFDRVAAILKDANYRGYVVLEYEEDGDVRSESSRYLDKLRDAF